MFKNVICDDEIERFVLKWNIQHVDFLHTGRRRIQVTQHMAGGLTCGDEFPQSLFRREMKNMRIAKQLVDAERPKVKH